MASKWLNMTGIFCIICLAVVHGTYWGSNHNCGISVKSEHCVDDEMAKLECPDDKLINVTSATYNGYKWQKIWRRWRWRWRWWRCGCDSDPLTKVQSICNGETECEFPCSDNIFNITSCSGDNWWGEMTAKYECVDNPCSTHCCSNGGTCQLTSDMTPMCVCNGTWNGSNCEDNPCDSVMCQNNGTCLINPADGTAHCVCTKDYTGTTCETEMPCNDTQMFENPCDSFTCENNGSCLINPLDNTARCCCTADYTGETCETKLDACSTTQCQNGGNCTVSITGQAVCQCPLGFVGTFCEVDCNATQPCPDGFQELPQGSGNCYFICDSDAESWLAAEAFCRLRQSVLWEPNDMDEVNAVTPQLDVNEEYWTGATDSLMEGTTIFSGSGQPLTLATAGTNTVTKDCVQYERETVAAGFQFIYKTCTVETRRCICERQNECNTPASPLSVPVPPVPPFFASP